MQMLRSARPASDHQLTWIQLFSWTATSADQLDLITGLLDGSTAVPGLSVNTELPWSLLQRLAASGRTHDASIDEELARDPTDAGQRHAAACRAAIPDAEHKEAAWQLLTGDHLGPESLAIVAGDFTQPEREDLLVPYAGRYLTELEKIWATRSGHLRCGSASCSFPYPAASPELLAQIDDFLTTPTRPRPYPRPGRAPRHGPASPALTRHKHLAVVSVKPRTPVIEVHARLAHHVA